MAVGVLRPAILSNRARPPGPHPMSASKVESHQIDLAVQPGGAGRDVDLTEPVVGMEGRAALWRERQCIVLEPVLTVHGADARNAGGRAPSGQAGFVFLVI